MLPLLTKADTAYVCSVYCIVYVHAFMTLYCQPVALHKFNRQIILHIFLVAHKLNQCQDKGFPKVFFSLLVLTTPNSQLLGGSQYVCLSVFQTARLSKRQHASSSRASQLPTACAKKHHSCTCGPKYSLCNHHKSNCTNDILS